MFDHISRRNFKNNERKTRNFKNNNDNGTGFPPQIRRRLVYEDTITVNPGLFRASYVFRGNSLFDPDYTSTGHQPRYYDTFTEVYEKYRVLGSSIVVEMTNISASGVAHFAVTPLTTVVAATTWHDAAELPNSRVSQLMPVSTRYPFSVSHSCTTKKVCGLMKSENQDEDWASTTGSNPIQLWYWNINIFDLASTNVNVGFRVRIIYDCIFYDRIEVTPSYFLKDPEKDHVKQTREEVGVVHNLVTVYQPPLSK